MKGKEYRAVQVSKPGPIMDEKRIEWHGGKEQKRD